MTYKRGIFLLFVIATVASAANEPQFAIRASHTDSNGVTFQTAAGTMRIEACGDRVIHVVASPTSEIPSPRSLSLRKRVGLTTFRSKLGRRRPSSPLGQSQSPSMPRRAQ